MKKLDVTGNIFDFLGRSPVTEEELTEGLGIDASELRALCRGDYDVLVTPNDEGGYHELRNAKAQHAANQETVYFIVVDENIWSIVIGFEYFHGYGYSYSVTRVE